MGSLDVNSRFTYISLQETITISTEPNQFTNKTILSKV